MVRNAVVMALILGLGGCGGGGSSAPSVVGSSPDPVPAPSTGSSPTPGAAPAPGTTPAPGEAPTPSPGTSPTPTPTPTPGPAAPPPALPTVDAGGNVHWSATQTPGEAGGIQLLIEPFAAIPAGDDGLPQRLNVMAHVQGQLYVGVERSGRIYRIEEGQAAALWFDLAAALPAHGRRLNAATNTGHSGLRSLAFHPDFASNGRFYVTAMVDRPAGTEGLHYLSGAGSAVAVDSVLMEWTANPASMQVDPSSLRELFRVGLDVYDHPIKQIAFGPDGFLYVAHGDGSEPTAAAGGGAHLGNALGKILRINPLAGPAGAYSIPADNPFVGTAGALAEIWSYGHRNPHHLAFLPDGGLVVAEPGHDNLDEINLVEKGGHHGWSAREGTYVHRLNGGRLDGIDILPADDATLNLVYPAIQFGHPGRRGQIAGGLALGGGYVTSNGSALDNRYFYCEFASWGEIYYAGIDELKASVRKGVPGSLTQAPIHQAAVMFDHDGDPSTPARPFGNLRDVVSVHPAYDGSGRADIRFGQGPDGTLYLMSKHNGQIYRIANSRPGSGS